MEDKWKELVKFIASNAYRESVCLTPRPEWILGATVPDLLDEIHRISGVSKESIGAWVDEAVDEKETK